MNQQEHYTSPVIVGPFGFILAAPGFFVFLLMGSPKLIPDLYYILLIALYIAGLTLGRLAIHAEGKWSNKGCLSIPIISGISLFLFNIFVYMSFSSQINAEGSWSGLLDYIYHKGLFSGIKSQLYTLVTLFLPLVLVLRFFNGGLIAYVQAPDASRSVKYQVLKVYRKYRHLAVVRFLTRHPYLIGAQHT